MADLATTVYAACSRCGACVNVQLAAGAVTDSEPGHVTRAADGSAYLLGTGEIYCAGCAHTIVFCSECGCTVEEAERAGAWLVLPGVCMRCDVERRMF